jgi:hypothetical protein
VWRGLDQGRGSPWVVDRLMIRPDQTRVTFRSRESCTLDCDRAVVRRSRVHNALDLF